MDSEGDKSSSKKTAALKIYKVKDFIRLTETGDINIPRSKEIVRQLAAAAAFHMDHNILLDMRDTEITEKSMASVMEVALEIARYKSVFKGKLANVVPDERTRIETAKQLRNLMEIRGFRYEIFTSFEDAVEWLSEVKVLS